MLRPTYILREKKNHKKIKEKPTSFGRPAVWARFFKKILPVGVEIFLKTGGLTLTMLTAGHTFGLSFIYCALDVGKDEETVC